MISSVWHNLVAQAKLEDGSLGRIIGMRANMYLQIEHVGKVSEALAKLKTHEQNVCSDICPVEKKAQPLRIVSKSQLGEALLTNAEARRRLTEENYLTAMWVREMKTGM